jgi:hypothetical protein
MFSHEVLLGQEGNWIDARFFITDGEIKDLTLWLNDVNLTDLLLEPYGLKVKKDIYQNLPRIKKWCE